MEPPARFQGGEPASAALSAHPRPDPRPPKSRGFGDSVSVGVLQLPDPPLRNLARIETLQNAWAGSAATSSRVRICARIVRRTIIDP